MSAETTGPAHGPERGPRHWLAFLAAGGLAFIVDGTFLYLLTSWMGLNPVLARVPAVLLAMLAGWLAHRTWTFRVEDPPSLPELLRYASVQALSIALNFALYALLLLVWPGLAPLLALVIASAVAMVTAYVGMALGVFRV